jgi:hypothetical protein
MRSPKNNNHTRLDMIFPSRSALRGSSWARWSLRKRLVQVVYRVDENTGRPELELPSAFRAPPSRWRDDLTFNFLMTSLSYSL